MKIRNKLFLSLILTAGLSASLASFAAIFSISQKYETIAREETLAKRKNAENFFYETEGELGRKALIITETEEIVGHMDNPDELLLNLESKGFLLYNVNTTILDTDKNIVASNNNSSSPPLTREELMQLPFIKENKDPLLRYSGIFKFKDRICMVVMSPLIDEDSFMSVGNLLFELYLNSDFADQLKDRTKGDIVIVSGKEQLGSTFQDDEGRRFYPEIPAVPEGKTATLEVFEKHHLAGGIPIIDFSKKTIGHIFTVVNIHDIIEAKKHGVTSILLVLLVVVVFVILLSLFIGQKLTGSILKLSQGAEALARGEFDLQLESNSKDEIGQLTRVFNKMTESLKAQREEILDLKLFFEKIIENSPSAIIICDIVSNAITINPAAEQLFNVSVDDVKGKEIFDVINLPPSLQADFYQVILSGNPSSYDSYRLALGEHEEKIFRLTFYEVSLKNSMSVAIQIEDITESLRLEEELTHAQKLGTLGEVLGRFTHEFNNLMAGIVGNVSLMKRSVKAEDNNFKRVRVIEDLAHRAQELGKNVLSFSKKEKMVTSRVEVRKLIDNVLGLVEKTVLKTIAVEKQYDTGPFPIMANMEKLSLALLNLLINARDAVKECKQPIICISVAHKEAESIAVTEIRVSDNGTGIDEKIAAKIFEPYFTTKGKKGTGLGLATVKDIVEKSGGKISVESVMGIGTTFVMRFPDVD